MPLSMCRVSFRFMVVIAAVGSLLAHGSLREVRAADPSAKPQAAEKRVLIVSIDGLRPDLALLADTPNIHALIKAGAYSMWAQTLPIGKTLPSHTSMITGVPMEKHGIIWNEDIPLRPRKYNYPHVPTLFEFAKKAGYTTALVAGKYKFEALAEKGTVDWVVLPEKPNTLGPDGKPISSGVADADGMKAYDRKYDDAWVGEQAAAVIAKNKPQVMMVHFPRVDTAGHAKGWGSTIQLEAIARADEALGVVLEALRKAKVFDDTLIILSADHGGYGKGHDGKDPRGLHIPWIAVGPGVRKGFDLTQTKGIINTVDTFSTAVDYLGIKITAEDEIEGKPVKDAFEPVTKSAAATTEK
ncbi:MAG: ectonucleotide pyrophosphatase/phosphodiesterase [Phycisphaeraceae bacterium]